MVAGTGLLGLLLAGLPLMALGGGADAGSGDDDSDFPGQEGSPDAVDMGDTLEPLSGTTSEVEPLPVDYEFLFRAGEHVIEGFRSGQDRLIITTGSWDLGVTSLVGEESGAALELERNGEIAMLRFTGHPDLPVEGIFLNVVEPGHDPVFRPLADFQEAAEPIQPTAPDTPDKLPEDSSAEEPLVPADPEAPDDLPDAGDGIHVLQPSDPDAPET